MFHIDIVIGHLGVNDLYQLADELLVLLAHGLWTGFTAGVMAALVHAVANNRPLVDQMLGNQPQLAGVERLDKHIVSTSLKTGHASLFARA